MQTFAILIGEDSKLYFSKYDYSKENNYLVDFHGDIIEFNIYYESDKKDAMDWIMEHLDHRYFSDELLANINNLFPQMRQQKYWN